ncbi:GNAT family N-acetyltransferase [Sporolactobacillus shoreicorticis]|uniref:GNAT family N-acetyltransferase n=1 Tax=Sporolactobacillus shoreicorticis TaxID=1923877 RepID=A0ABW5S533_9BACL|nr:GNAT family N-acetyltransferase [Sporolactobacillus shoreicorticis]MCO7126493.1 GNAT family N-acetyltransferase [Sporolactobacillus shoreicorticis]
MNEPQLQSNRLFLYPLSIRELTQINSNDSDTIEISFDSETMSESFQAAISKKIRKMKRISEKLHPWYTYWAIIDKTVDKGIGFVGFKGFPNKKGYSEIGYGMSLNFRKRGLMTEAVNTLAEWARLNPNCKGVTARVLKTNVGSIKVLKNCGFQIVTSDELECIFVDNFI